MNDNWASHPHTDFELKCCKDQTIWQQDGRTWAAREGTYALQFWSQGHREHISWDISQVENVKEVFKLPIDVPYSFEKQLQSWGVVKKGKSRVDFCLTAYYDGKKIAELRPIRFLGRRYLLKNKGAPLPSVAFTPTDARHSPLTTQSNKWLYTLPLDVPQDNNSLHLREYSISDEVNSTAHPSPQQPNLHPAARPCKDDVDLWIDTLLAFECGGIECQEKPENDNQINEQLEGTAATQESQETSEKGSERKQPERCDEENRTARVEVSPIEERKTEEDNNNEGEKGETGGDPERDLDLITALMLELGLKQQGPFTATSSPSSQPSQSSPPISFPFVFSGTPDNVQQQPNREGSAPFADRFNQSGCSFTSGPPQSPPPYCTTTVPFIFRRSHHNASLYRGVESNPSQLPYFGEVAQPLPGATEVVLYDAESGLALLRSTAVDDHCHHSDDNIDAKHHNGGVSLTPFVNMIHHQNLYAVSTKDPEGERHRVVSVSHCENDGSPCVAIGTCCGCIALVPTPCFCRCMRAAHCTKRTSQVFYRRRRRQTSFKKFLSD